MNGKGNAGYDCAELAQTYGTPLMIMDESRIRSRCRKKWEDLIRCDV